jgi:hypothetical protein
MSRSLTASRISAALARTMTAPTRYPRGAVHAISFSDHFGLRKSDFAMLGLTTLWCVIALAEQLLRI